MYSASKNLPGRGLTKVGKHCCIRMVQRCGADKNTISRVLHHFSTEWVPLALRGRIQKETEREAITRYNGQAGFATVSVTTGQQDTQSETYCWMICLTTLHPLRHYLLLTSQPAFRLSVRDTCWSPQHLQLPSHPPVRRSSDLLSRWHTSETLGGQKEREIVVELDVDTWIILKWTLKDCVGGGAVERIRLALKSSCNNGHGSWCRRKHDSLFIACGIKSG